MPYFTPAELAAYLRLPSADELDTARAELLGALAGGLIAPIIVSVPALATDVRVKGIALEVVARAYRNPEGYVEESLDDWRGKLPEAAARAGVYLTNAERAELRELTLPGAGRRVRSIMLVSDSTADTDTQTLPTA